MVPRAHKHSSRSRAYSARSSAAKKSSVNNLTLLLAKNFPKIAAAMLETFLGIACKMLSQASGIANVHCGCRGVVLVLSLVKFRRKLYGLSPAECQSTIDIGCNDPLSRKFGVGSTMRFRKGVRQNTKSARIARSNMQT